MKQGWLWSVMVGLACGSPALAQNWQFRWAKGQVLTYKAEHVTSVIETAEGSKTATASKLNLIKRWQVTDVDGKGIATLQLSLDAMRTEQTRPSGETLLFDSANPDKSTPELKEQMARYIGVPLAVLRLDAQGRIVEVKQGQASKYEAEPPFAVVFPPAAPAQGQSWLRPFPVTLDPPYGTGEKFEATQRYQCTKLEGPRATLAVTTQFKTLPAAAKDQIPLLQKMVGGEVLFDVQAGRLLQVQFNIERTLQNHQGEGSSYEFTSRYTEQLVDVK